MWYSGYKESRILQGITKVVFDEITFDDNMHIYLVKKNWQRTNIRLKNPPNIASYMCASLNFNIDSNQC
jgi:hypothetical protein